MISPSAGSRGRYAVLALILAVGLWLRLDGLAFGLPSLLDPDEPIFILTGLRLLADHTLNPGWFGHPGTTTIYALAVIEIATYGAWHLAGRFADVHAFGVAVYNDPALIFLPGRIFILVCGMATVALSYVVARRLFGTRIALLAAMLLAIDPLHIRYSQIIRTDMHASVFVLLEILAAMSIVERGRRRDYILAAIVLGFACATKWPTAACIAAVIGAAATRLYRGDDTPRGIAGKLALFGVTALVALFVASPYLFLDIGTVIENLHGEERPFHLGATGGGLLGNMAWYISGPLVFGTGIVGVLLAGAGCWVGARISTAFAATVLPVVALFFVMISAQALVWERWLIPLLPLLAICAAVALSVLADVAAARCGRRIGLAVAGIVAAALVVPVMAGVRGAARERATDTRTLATAWARAHIARGSTVTVEHGAFDILGQPWRFLFPMGTLGCVDVRAALDGQVSYARVGAARAGRPVIDIGTIAPNHLATCRGDWAILVNRDRYLAESARFPAENARYARFLRGGRIVATFRPIAGEVGGPVVRVIRFPR